MNYLSISLLIFSIIGIGISYYLITSRIKKKQVICPITHNCNQVLESEWSQIFHIKNDILGACYYILIFAEALYLLYISKNILFYMELISGIALMFSIFLFYVQSRIIKNYCFYCILSSLLNLLIFINIILINN